MLTILSVLFCLGLSVQDLRQRRVHVALVALLAGTGLVQRWTSGEERFCSSLLSNLLIILVILASILLVYRLRGERRILDRKLGSGDVAVLLALACWMETETFIAFYCLSTAILAACFGILYLARRLPSAYPIPLAGLWSLAFSGWQIAQLLMG